MGYVVCGNCAAPVPPQDWNTGSPLPCRSCAQDVEVLLFAASAHRPPYTHPERVLAGEEAGCYHHPRNKAVAACEHCGRFLCALCEIISVDQAHLCPACFEAAPQPVERVNHDSIALALAALPTLFCWLPIITTPIALFLAIRAWNQPSPVVNRSRWRLYATFGVAILQVLAVVAFVIMIRRGGPA